MIPRHMWLKSFAVVAALLPGANAWSAEHRTFCFSPAYAGWRGFPVPTIDGVIDFPQEKGWAPAFKYVFGNGTPDPDVVVYGFFDNVNLLEMGFTIRNDKTYDDTDQIAILFEYDDATPKYGELIINPIAKDIANQSGPPGSPGYAHYNTTDNADDATVGAHWTSGVTDPAWLKVQRVTTPDGVNSCAGAENSLPLHPGTKCRWDVEISIDRSVAGAPPVFQIKRMFVDVVRADRSSGSAQAVEFTWPQDITSAMNNYTFGDFDHFNQTGPGIGPGTPPTAIWGPAKVNESTSCNGVWFRGMGATISDITSSGGNVFTQNQQVTLSAHIHNSSVDGATGTGMVAKSVSATFYHAPFGMTGFNNFIQIPPVAASANPKNPTDPLDIAYDGPTDFNTVSAGTQLKVDWKPTTLCPATCPAPPASCDCDTGHQCMLVMLTSTVNNTSFVNQAEFQNMWINPASRFDDGAAVISVKGQPVPQGATRQRLQIASTQSVQFSFADGSIGIPGGTLTSQLTWLFHGARFTGRYLTIKGVKHEVWTPLASYGYIVQHPLPTDVQKAFEERHANLVGPLHDGRPTPERISAVNHELRSDADKPDPASWRVEMPKISNARVVPNTQGQVLELELPIDGTTRAATTVVFDERGGGGGGGCCPPSGKTTPSRVGSLGLGILVGAVVLRRRRRR